MVNSSRSLLDDSWPYFCLGKLLKDYGVDESTYADGDDNCVWLRDSKSE